VTSLCPLVHDEDAEVEYGLAVCRSHARATQSAVVQLPGLHADLTYRLITTGASLTGMPHAPSKDPGISLDHRVVQCRSDIRNVLATWARHVVEERQVHPPTDRIYAISLFLAGHVTWLLSQAYGPAFCLDMVGPWETAKMLIQPNASRTFTVGPCPEPECTGTLVARLRPQDSLLPAVVVCDHSPLEDDGTLSHAWTADKWLTLGRKIRRTEP
jgi:hypothetical protein